MRILATTLAVALMLLVAPSGADARPYMHGIPSPPHVTVVSEACPDIGDGSCATADTIYLDDPTDRFARQHELGHLADAQLLNDAERAWLTPMLGARGPWIQETGAACGSGARCPNERFADAYATCRLGWTPNRGEWADAYGYDPTARTQRRICAALRSFLAN